MACKLMLSEALSSWGLAPYNHLSTLQCSCFSHHFWFLFYMCEGLGVWKGHQTIQRHQKDTVKLDYLPGQFMLCKWINYRNVLNFPLKRTQYWLNSYQKGIQRMCLIFSHSATWDPNCYLKYVIIFPSLITWNLNCTLMLLHIKLGRRLYDQMVWPVPMSIYCNLVSQSKYICLKSNFSRKLISGFFLNFEYKQMNTQNYFVLSHWDLPNHEDPGSVLCSSKKLWILLPCVFVLGTAGKPWISRGGPRWCKSDTFSRPHWTSNHQRIIHWMPVVTQLWMNLNWVNSWFHLDNQLCRKIGNN